MRRESGQLAGELTPDRERLNRKVDTSLSRLRAHLNSLEPVEVGTVTSVSRGVVRLTGLPQLGSEELVRCRRRSENVAPGGEWPSDEKRSAQMITCGSFFRLSEVPKSFELAYCGRQGCSPTWISGLRFAVAF